MSSLEELWGKVVKAAEIVEKGGVIIYPTDTVYGIGCNPFNARAVERVYGLKKRENKPSPVLVSDLNQLRQVADPKPAELRAALLLWPGPVTIVMARKPSLPESVTFGKPTVGVRMPSDAVTLAIMQLSGLPLLGTSANLSGHPPARSPSELDPELVKGVDIVVECGRTLYGRPSTVIEVAEEGVRVVREGALSEYEVKLRLNR